MDIHLISSSVPADRGKGAPMDTATAWQQFHAGQEPRGVRGEVLTSWRRSRISGVDPEHADVPYVETELDTHFTRVATPIMEGMAELLVGDRSCLALADPRGSVTWRWVSEPMLRGTLDRLSVAEGFCWGEDRVGTNGLGTALETGAIAVVRGSEHFVHRFHDFTCVAAPVRHPVTRRTVGAVNVTCRAEHTNPLLAVVVRKLVDEIRSALLHESSARERRLLDAFLVAQRGATGPVLTLGDDVVIANGAAQELGLDHQELWAEVRGRADGTLVVLPSDVSARLSLVRDGPTTTGAVLTVTDPAPHRRAAAPDRWQGLVSQARSLVARGPLAVRGEAGTGKATLLAAALPDALVLDAATCAVDGLPAWARRLAGADAVVVRHVELLPDGAAATVAALVDDRFAVTVDGPDHLVDRIGAATLTLPPLRRRTDEITGLARRELRRHDERLAFAPETLSALRRYPWPGNVRELVRVVADAARHARGGVIGLGALPPAVRAAASQRTLTPLERAESSVIAAVLQECGGNKSAAAKQLGISRTALYAKLRTYRL
jgi:sigma-54 dependent transcriptional regulator, acetoin dehydrogenase operon transcriptional activator AcoR